MNEDMPVHTTTLNGRTVKTTWAPTKIQAKAKEEVFRLEGAEMTKVFTNGGIEKYRVVGYWK